MFANFSHYLAFGSTDQQTLNALAGSYDGLIVPGTVAAFRADGTKGFVLALSAASDVPYAVDPRFPLFQNDLEQPKQSHLALAAVMGIEELVKTNAGLPLKLLTPELVSSVAKRWVDFNTGFQDLATKSFDKYARRLKKPTLSQTHANRPSRILAPYLMQDGSPEKQKLAHELWQATVEAASKEGSGTQVQRVVAVKEPDQLASLVPDGDDNEVLIWVNNLEEAKSPQFRLAQYATQVYKLRQSGIRPFAIYGGYFAVMLRSFGLAGMSHGVGFSEHRNYIELKSSGGAPARYYVRKLHRYLPVELASELWRRNPNLINDAGTPMGTLDPAELDYQSLMRHSVLARAQEISDGEDSTMQEHIDALSTSYKQFIEGIESIRLTEGLRKRALDHAGHLEIWRLALDEAYKAL